MAIRELASFRMSWSRERLFSERISSLLSSTVAAPEIPVKGVRRSWDTARKMLPRMVSRAASSWMAFFSSLSRSLASYSSLVFCSRRAASRAWFLMVEVRPQMMMAMTTMLTIATG